MQDQTLLQLLLTRHGVDEDGDLDEEADGAEPPHHGAAREEGMVDPFSEIARAAQRSWVRNVALAQVAEEFDEMGLYAAIPDEAEPYLHPDVAQSQRQKHERDE